MDKVVDKVAALGIPGLVLVIAMGTTGFAGAAAVTATLAALGGPLGMIGGIGVFLLLGMIGQALARYGMERLFGSVVDRLLSKGYSLKQIKSKIMHYPISKKLKEALLNRLDSYAEGTV